ncbi:hypothetical protein B6S12_05775 [Helicobacter valdiviensis]|uniref:Uncharacterized protein n=1 Tax=Helicobacter valdiviensis TaxID=1458358 RepID=A0A2W6NKW6_9HELI|nr:hypothetical protein [Helicobacter valdiviensis]PZT48056.1 hypothetical protein B6S12_05775 [Helicobacter valdiviensis]
MKILYAPSIREFSDNIIANLQATFDRQILETLMGEGREILYLPHQRTDKRIKDNILRGGGAFVGA